MDYYRKVCNDVKPDIIVSFGSASFFCKQLEGYHRIFLNPNYLPSDDLKERREFFPKAGITQELIDAYQEVEKGSLLVKGNEKCCVVYGEPDEDEIYPTWDDPDLNSLKTINVGPWKSPDNWMNTFLYPLIDTMVK